MSEQDIAGTVKAFVDGMRREDGNVVADAAGIMLTAALTDLRRAAHALEGIRLVLEARKG